MAIDWSGHMSPLERQKVEAARLLSKREECRMEVSKWLDALNNLPLARRQKFYVITGGKRAATGSLGKSNL